MSSSWLNADSNDETSDGVGNLVVAVDGCNGVSIRRGDQLA